MRTVKRTAQFRRDFSESSGVYTAGISTRPFSKPWNLLAADVPLPPRYVDHPMKGQYNDCRDCHLRPDLVLVYRKRDPDVPELIRIGTHAQLAI